MQSKIFDSGGIIRYNILPENKDVEFAIISTKTGFDQLLDSLNGQLINVEAISKPKIQTEEHPFFYRTYYSAKLYKLVNGQIIIDQSSTKKANPFYICNSISDFLLITQYLHIYKQSIGTTQRVFTECVMYNSEAIRQLAKSIKFEKVFHLPQLRTVLFQLPDDKIVYLRYWEKEDKVESSIEVSNSLNKSLPQFLNECRFSSLVIYESMDHAKLMGAFDADE